MSSFIKRNLWGLLLILCFVSAILAAFSTYGTVFFWPSVGASFATLIAAIVLFRHPFEPEPFRQVYTYGDWDMGDGMTFPTLTIPADTHGMGSTPHLEFTQGSFIFPWEPPRPDGTIVIVRNNYSVGRFDDLGVVVRHRPH